jgi:hypothetical protein
MTFKICPECGVEHVRTALVCSDCNVALVSASGEVAAPAAAAELPPAAELVRIAAGGPWELERLARELQESGISSRIGSPLPTPPISRGAASAATRASPGSGARLALYVLPADLDPARRLLEKVLLPEAPDGVAPGAEGDALEACPACGAPISGVASACSDCGLEFVAVDEVCSSCAAPISAGATACHSCGAPSPRAGAG